MRKIITTEKLPIKMWLDDIEEGAMQQARNLANLPFAFRHIAIMPDCHEGYGMPIGGVLAARDFIIPNAVGVDIGCGMCAVKTSLDKIDKKILQKIVDEIKEIIPVGHRHQSIKQDEKFMPKGFKINKMHIVNQEYESAREQIGTLGSGNHFIEIQKGSDGCIWIMLHSGSRNIGKKVADYYNKIAIELDGNLFKDQFKIRDLAFLPVNSEEARRYLYEMDYCIQFAFSNRVLMIERIKDCFVHNIRDIFFSPLINIAHNYAAREKHFNRIVYVHRKGATSARKGETGIIPGSQGTQSYIVEGLGNPESFMSCSHGAGRIMSRHYAQKNLNYMDEVRYMEKKGIIHSMKSSRDLDEAPGAYKNIHDVMTLQKDLVKILVELDPLAVVKG
ncbi:MAG: RtcB family protein [Bacteroidota bacterium]|nr:RtcB family protein [Bacteroidota bacterium]